MFVAGNLVMMETLCIVSCRRMIQMFLSAAGLGLSLPADFPHLVEQLDVGVVSWPDL